MKNNRRLPVRALGEIVLRVRDIDAMQAFYRDVLGLEVMRRFDDDAVFFRIGEGYGGHTTTLVLFTVGWPSNREGHAWRGHDAAVSTLHHFALTIALDDYDAVMADLKDKGVPFNVSTYSWVGWRSIHIQDPEQNCVELVAYDDDVLAPETDS